MTPNVGGIDRAFRIALGLVIIAVGANYRSWWGALGALPLFTGMFSWCPVYVPFGTTTYKAPPARA